jgi:hypothetical protein
VGVRHGKGRHVCALDNESIAAIGRYSWINQIILFWALFFIKVSVCLLVLRVKSTALLRWTSGIVTALMITSTIVACAALLAECKPVSAYWNRSSGECRAPTFRIYSIWVQAGTSVVLVSRKMLLKLTFFQLYRCSLIWCALCYLFRSFGVYSCLLGKRLQSAC